MDNHVTYIVHTLIQEKIKYMRCQHLLFSTSPRSKIRPNGNNFIIEISCYAKDCLVVYSYSNFLIELKCVIRFINKKKMMQHRYFSPL